MELINLTNQKNNNLIKDIVLFPLKVNQDETGGVLVESLRRDWEGVYGNNREFHMQYFSITPTGMARDEKDWHLHKEQEDRFVAVYGEIVVATADYRKESETNGLLNLFHIKPLEEPYLVLIPKGVLHGFIALGLEPGILLNYPTAIYNPDDELRVPHDIAKIKTEEGELFCWDMVRKKFQS